MGAKVRVMTTQARTGDRPSLPGPVLHGSLRCQAQPGFGCFLPFLLCSVSQPPVEQRTSLDLYFRVTRVRFFKGPAPLWLMKPASRDEVRGVTLSSVGDVWLSCCLPSLWLNKSEPSAGTSRGCLSWSRSLTLKKKSLHEGAGDFDTSVGGVGLPEDGGCDSRLLEGAQGQPEKGKNERRDMKHMGQELRFLTIH